MIAADLALLDALSDAVLSTDTAGTLTGFNRAAATLYGLTGAHVGQPLWSLVTHLHTTPGGVPEETHLRRDGRVLTVRRTAVPVLQDGIVAGHRHVVQDLTRARAETDTMQMLRGVAGHASDSIILIDVLGPTPESMIVRYVNAAFTERTGIPAGEIVGRPLQLSPDLTGNSELWQACQAALRERQSVTLDFPRPAGPKGDARVLEIRLMPFADMPDRWIGLIRDVTAQRRMDERLKMMEQAVNHAQDGILLCDLDLRTREASCIYVNPSFTRLTGFGSPEVVGRHPIFLIEATMTPAELRDVAERVMAGTITAQRMQLRRRDGQLMWTDLTFSVVSRSGSRTTWMVMLRDANAEVWAETVALDTRAVLEMAVQGRAFSDVLDAVCRMVTTQVQGASAVVAARVGEEVMVLASDVRSRDLLNQLRTLEPFRTGAEGGSIGLAMQRNAPVIVTEIHDYPGPVRYCDAFQALGVQGIWTVPTHGPHEQPTGAIAVYVPEGRAPGAEERRLIGDAAHLTSLILERDRAQRELQHLALFDPLTGLPNRSQFQALLTQEVQRAQRDGHRFAVGLLDLDRFKGINDTLGHDAGDDLLQQVASRLRSMFREEDVVARMGGDEFTLLLSFHGERDQVRAGAVRQLQRIFESPFLLGGREVFVRGSLGLALYPEDALTGVDLLRQADVAMYQAKRSGQTVTLFDERGGDSVTELHLEADLYRALDRGELRVTYQPTFNAASRLVGAEALLSWLHPVQGVVPPAVFIPMAEHSGLIVQIGRWVLREATRQLALWQRQYPHLTVSVNLSARQFRNNDLVRDVQAIVEESGIRPGTLVLEVTESLLMDVPDAQDVLMRLRELEIELDLDDFGTGYSSLSYLQRFPFTGLKIDRSFMTNLDLQPDGRGSTGENIVRSVVALAHSLHLSVTAEGVETQAQAEFLRGIGCEVLQGYLLGRPVAPEAFPLELLSVNTPVR